MTHSFRSLILLALACVGTICATAMPAHPGKRTVRMADGTLREVILRGDERCNWLETPEGVRLTSPRSAMPHVTATPEQRAKLRRKANSSMLIDGCFPATGKRKLLAVLVNYADTKPSITQENFHAMMNEKDYQGIGSFRDYYLQQSYGQLDIETTVTRWVTLSKSKSMYSGDYVTNLIHETLTQLDAEIDFRDYDNDGDGILDGLIILHQGLGQEASADANDIWSHSSTVYGMQFDGVTIYRYTIEPELYADRNAGKARQTGIGVVCHEFGHNLGASDYYDTNYDTNGSYGGTGTWDIMGSGAWNGPTWISTTCGDAPAPFSAWQKIQFGWMEPTVLEGSQSIADMPAVSTAPVCYRLNTTVAGDYYILENRQKTSPWDFYAPGHGLLVTHAIESIIREELPTNTINAQWPQGLYTVCADAKRDPKEGLISSYGDPTLPSNTFSDANGFTAFSDETLPSCKSASGRLSYVALEEISEAGTGNISFNYVQQEAPQKPENLTATVLKGIVQLTWTLPEGTTTPDYFTLYRNGEKLATTHELSYTDATASTTGIITYTVDATYPNGLISAYAETSTRIPVNRASDLTLTETDGQLAITWKQPNELSRCTDNMKYNLTEHITSDFRYAHRYRPEDLLPYIGYKIRSVAFIPNQPSMFASYKICVWRATPGSREAELVSSRNVTEFSPTYKRTVLFTSQATIEAGFEYWIGVQISSTNNAAEVITDQSELVDGYGNWMSMGGTAWQTDPTATGNFIINATLTAPTSPLTGQDIPLYADLDSTIDLYFPLGYRVYCDDTMLGTTTLTSFTTPLPSAEVGHTYSVVSLYKGENESRAITASYGTEGMGSITLPAMHTSGSASHIYNLQGQRINVTTPARGLYIMNGKKILR